MMKFNVPSILCFTLAYEIVSLLSQENYPRFNSYGLTGNCNNQSLKLLCLTLLGLDAYVNNFVYKLATNSSIHKAILVKYNII